MGGISGERRRECANVPLCLAVGDMDGAVSDVLNTQSEAFLRP
jgi:hypothetical protein